MACGKEYRNEAIIRYISSVYYLPYKSYVPVARTAIKECVFVKKDNLLGKFGILTLDSLKMSMDRVPYREKGTNGRIEDVVKSHEKNIFYIINDKLDSKTKRELENNLLPKERLNFFQQLNYSLEIKLQYFLNKLFGYGFKN